MGYCSSQKIVSSHRLEIRNIMEWFPIVAGTFKVVVLGTGMFFAIKWHYDKGKKEKAKKNAMSAPPAPAEQTLKASD